MTSRATIHVTSRATCRDTQMRGGGEVVDDEPTRGGVVDDEHVQRATRRAARRAEAPGRTT
jgi:hypothetical protein